MEKKNQKLFIVVGALLLVIGVSFSYFLAMTLISGEGSSTVGTTAIIKDTLFTVNGTLEFDDTGVYPGHRNVSKITVTAKNNPGLVIDYNLIWNGRNGLVTPINYYVYKTSSSENPSISCSVKTGMRSGYEIYYEECENNNFDNLGEIISSGTITNSNESRKIILKENENITSSEEGETVYYYVVLEYPNLDAIQNRDKESTFEGEVTVELYEKNACGTHNVTTILGVLEVNDCEPDFNYTSEQADNVGICYYNGYSIMEGATEESCQKLYQFVETETHGPIVVDKLTYEEMMSGYEMVGTATWDSDSRKCMYNNQEVSYYTGYKITYFASYCGTVYAKEENGEMKYITGISEKGSGEWVKIESGQTGIYEAEDGMYGGTSYYYRGDIEDNHVIFADKCWRIVRINGDGSIRLIYNGGVQNGNTCAGNGENADSIAVAEQSYSKDGLYDKNEYAGYTYTEGLQRPENKYNATESNLKTQTDSWLTTNITGANFNKIADGKFCNAASYYIPTLHCSEEETYILKAGAITLDEGKFAGGNGKNTSYYLYNGQDYWTMSPDGWGEVSITVDYVSSDGYLRRNSVSSEYGVRPVINLRSDITFSGGNGLNNTPFVVAN